MQDTYCRNCGVKLNAGAVFCPKCGTKVKKMGVNKVEKTGVNKAIDQKSSKSPIILIGAGIFVLFILFMVVGSAFSSDSSSNSQDVQSSSDSSSNGQDVQSSSDSSSNGQDVQAAKDQAIGDYYEWKGTQDLSIQQGMDQLSDNYAKSYDFSPSPETDTATVGDPYFDPPDPDA